MATPMDPAHGLSDSVQRVAEFSRAWHRQRSSALLQDARTFLQHGAPPRLRDVLGIAHREVPLNRTLGWLLDPAADHGAEGRVLASFASWLGAHDLARDALSGRVERPWCEQRPPGWLDTRQPDLVVRGHTGALLVENKVLAAEGPNQFADYRRAFEAWAPAHARVLVVMARTPRAAPPQYAFQPHSALAAWARRASVDPELPTWSRVVLAMLGADLEPSDALGSGLAELRRIVEGATDEQLDGDRAIRLATLLGSRSSFTPWSR